MYHAQIFIMFFVSVHHIISTHIRSIVDLFRYLCCFNVFYISCTMYFCQKFQFIFSIILFTNIYVFGIIYVMLLKLENRYGAFKSKSGTVHIYIFYSLQMLSIQVNIYIIDSQYMTNKKKCVYYRYQVLRCHQLFLVSLHHRACVAGVPIHVYFVQRYQKS